MKDWFWHQILLQVSSATLMPTLPVAWNTEDSAGPSSVYLQTGYIITYDDCLVLWVSRLQTEIALKVQWKQNILHSNRQCGIWFCSWLWLWTSLLKIEYTDPEVQYKNSKMLLTADVYEDNRGALELAKMPKLRPCTKHIVLKCHHFHEHVRNGKVHIHAVDTREQLADIFMKALPREALQLQIRKIIQNPNFLQFLRRKNWPNF